MTEGNPMFDSLRNVIYSTRREGGIYREDINKIFEEARDKFKARFKAIGEVILAAGGYPLQTVLRDDTNRGRYHDIAPLLALATSNSYGAGEERSLRDIVLTPQGDMLDVRRLGGSVQIYDIDHARELGADEYVNLAKYAFNRLHELAVKTLQAG